MTDAVRDHEAFVANEVLATAVTFGQPGALGYVVEGAVANGDNGAQVGRPGVTATIPRATSSSSDDAPGTVPSPVAVPAPQRRGPPASDQGLRAVSLVYDHWQHVARDHVTRPKSCTAGG